jgi:hypothetical protein
MAADINTLETIERIRKLVKTHGIAATARAVGMSSVAVGRIKNGKRRGPDKRPYGVPKTTLEDLGLHLNSTTQPKRCTRCGEKPMLLTRYGSCVECELLYRSRKGLLKIEAAAY